MIKRLLCLILGTIFAISLMACEARGTGGQINPETGEPEGLLKINTVDLGFGIKWLENLEKGFEKKYPKVDVDITSSKLTSKVYLYLTTNKSNDFDLIFVETSFVFGYAQDKYLIPGVTQPYEDLTKVFTDKIPGEEVSISDKLYKGLPEYFTSSDGKIYNIPYAMTLFGLMYNYDVIDGMEYKVPKTTNQLVALSRDLKADGVNPLVWTKDANYFDQMIETWWAQYEGDVKFKEYYQGKVDGKYSVKALQQQGRLKSLEVLESLIDYNGGYSHPSSPGFEYIPAQRSLMNGESAMSPVGSWIENEMSNFYEKGSAPIDYMGTPVISSIVEKLEYRNGGSLMTDNLLITIIDAVDAGETSYEGVSEADFKKIADARNMYYYENIINSAVMPSWSDAKDLGKLFLQYMYSDEGINDYTSADSGGSLPVYHDYSDLYANLSRLQQTRLRIMGSENNFIFKPRNGAILNSFRTTSVQQKIGAVSNKMTAKEVFDFDYNYYSANGFAAWTDLLKANNIKV